MNTSQERTIQISDWKAFQKNTLRGFFTVTLPSGLVIHKCTLHQKNESRWVGLPAEKYTKQDGSSAYAVLVEFTSRDRSESFREQVLRALEAQGLA